jgi:tRNA dimethylallyltransferase
MQAKIIIVTGPTAVGKSDVALFLAEKLDAEIVNADSQQVYRYMDIGTDKPTPEERARVAHHLIDIVDPDEDFNAAMYAKLAADALENIRERGKRVIVCGGTGLYIKALTHGLFVGPAQNREIRERLTGEIAERGLETLYKRMVQSDPASGLRIHPHDRQRIIRALEVYELTGKTITEWQNEHAFRARRFLTLKIGLDRDRGELYDLINKRCDQMIQDGLLDEVRGLLSKGYDLNLKALQSLGYKHVGWFIAGVVTLEEAATLMKRDTRRLAKRQLTWFRADPEIRWFHPERKEELTSLARDFLT